MLNKIQNKLKIVGQHFCNGTGYKQRPRIDYELYAKILEKKKEKQQYQE